MSEDPRRSIRALLELQETGKDRFTAPTPAEGPPRLFGGQVAAQALRAACATVEEARPVHSLHSYFIRPGRPDSAMELVVERTRDGRSFTTRHVTALQEDKAIFTLTASFHAPEEGTDWQLPAPEAERPTDAARHSPSEPFATFWRDSFFLIQSLSGSSQRPLLHPAWIRLAEDIGDDPVLQACALTYVSDMAVVFAARAPADRIGFGGGGASLDHSVWFHRPFDIRRWLLFSVDAVTNYGARGLARGTFHTEDGALVASLAQEGLLRPTGGPRWPADIEAQMRAQMEAGTAP
jgi:acyl-CoA thioesterase-2